MDQELVGVLLSLRNITVGVFVVAAGLFGFTLYAFVVITRIQQGMWLQLRRQYADIDQDLQAIKNLLRGQ